MGGFFTCRQTFSGFLLKLFLLESYRYLFDVALAQFCEVKIIIKTYSQNFATLKMQ